MMNAISQPKISVSRNTGTVMLRSSLTQRHVASGPSVPKLTTTNDVTIIATQNGSLMKNALAEVDESRLLEGELLVSSKVKIPSARSRKIWKLAKGGMPRSEIAAQMKVEPRSVGRAITQVNKWLAAAVAVDLVGYKANSHSKLSVIYEQAMLGWHKSGGVVTKRVKKYGPDPFNPESKERVILEETETEEYRAGDPKFLTVAMKALADQREMLPGANAPKATALTNQSGTGDALLNIDMRSIVASITQEQAEVLLGRARQVRQQISQASAAHP